MKGGQSLNHLQQKRKEKEEEQWVKPQPCLICGKTIEGAYAQHPDGWTCCNKCMKVQDAKPKYPGHSEEEFLNRQGEPDASVSSGEDG